MLYVASHAKIVDGRREAVEYLDFVSLPDPPSATFSTKIIAIDVRRLLEGASEDEYMLWVLEEDTSGLQGQSQLPGLTTAPLTLANGVLFHASTGGYFRGLDVESGSELFRRTPLTFMRPDLGQIVAVPILGGITIVDGKAFVAPGTSQFPFVDGQPTGVVAYGFPNK